MITSVDYDKLNEYTVQYLMQPYLKKKKLGWDILKTLLTHKNGRTKIIQIAHRKEGEKTVTTEEEKTKEKKSVIIEILRLKCKWSKYISSNALIGRVD